MIGQPELQSRTLQRYGELLCRREDWSRRLVMAAFRGAAASGIAAAASLAGAVSLVTDADGGSMKSHFRDGAFDFVVNTLDEALRAIKNEIRKGNSIAIGLIGEPAAVLDEAKERGLTADFILNEDEASAAATPELTAWLAERRWSVEEISAPIAERLLAGSSYESDTRRLRWLRDLAAHQRSVRRADRYVWLSVEERQALELGTA